MPRPTARQRSDPDSVRLMVDAIFEGVSGNAKRSYCEFLAASIAFLSQHYADRWGVTLREYGIRLNAGMVESLILRQGEGLRVLVEKKTAPLRAGFDGAQFRYAPGCETVVLSLSDVPRSLARFADSHRAALQIAAEAMPPRRNIRGAHSPGVTKWLSQVLHRPVPSPARPSQRLHLVQGGISNGDKAALEGRRVHSWMVPKTAARGDELVIYIRGIGFFATARTVSPPSPRTDWKRRYRADVDSVRLIRPPVPLAAIRRHVPDSGWAKSPRSITTPPPEVADKIRALIRARSLGDVDAGASIDELRMIAVHAATKRVPARAGRAAYRSGAAAIRRYVLARADGRCEGCGASAPFRGVDGYPFLEAHHITRLADDGPDHPLKVIGVCPNCHRRAQSGRGLEIV